MLGLPQPAETKESRASFPHARCADLGSRGSGPIDGRFSSARRPRPPTAPPDAFAIVRTAPPPWPRTERWETRFQLAFDSAPGGSEVRARRCAPDRVVTETRIREGEAYRVVSRTTRRPCARDE